MTSKPPLRAVTDADKPAPKPKLKTLKAAADSSERDLLVMMREKISDEIGNGVPPHTLAPLMRQMREIDKEIRAIDQRAKHEAEEDGDENVTDEAWDEEAL